MCRMQGGRQRGGDGGGRDCCRKDGPGDGGDGRPSAVAWAGGFASPPACQLGSGPDPKDAAVPWGHQALSSSCLRGAGAWLDPTTPWETSGRPRPLAALCPLGGQWGLFLLAQLENTHGPATGWRHSGTRTFPAVSPGCFFTRGHELWEQQRHPVASRCYQPGGCRAQGGHSAASASLFPASPCRISDRAAAFLAVRSCCPQPTSEEVTGKLPDFIPAGRLARGSRGTAGRWRSAWLPASGDVPGWICVPRAEVRRGSQTCSLPRPSRAQAIR